MKIPAYTRDKNVQNHQANFTKSVVKKIEWQKTRSKVDYKYKSLQNYLEWGIVNISEQFSIGNYMSTLLSNTNSQSILCLGSGDAYIEYIIKKKLPKTQLTITDYDDVLISNLKRLLRSTGNIKVLDIKKDNFAQYTGQVDTVFMAATFYVFTDEEAISFFRRLNVLKPKHIFILAVAYLWPEDILSYIISHYFGGSTLGKIKATLSGKKIQSKPSGRFHGWTRSESEFKRILRSEGSFKLQKVYRYKNNPHDHAILHIVPCVI